LTFHLLRVLSLKITVECEKPRYAKGKYEFEKLQDVFEFLDKIRGFAKGTIGSWLLLLAKDGYISYAHTARWVIGMKSDFHDYQLAQKVARETGLVKAFDKRSSDVGVALRFAKAFDEEASKH
jgi:hypothetical protein